MVPWESDPTTELPGVPQEQTLERLVCLAIARAYPDRGPLIDQWLDSRPSPPAKGAKEFAWSHMAGWYAENGCADFYRCVWDDPKIAEQRVGEMRDRGYWRIIEELAD